MRGDPVQVSKSEFARIKALARKAKRIDRIADNLALSVQGTQTARQEPSKQPNTAPGRLWGSRDKGYAFGRAQKARKPRPMSQKLQIKAIKKRILGTGGLWSQAVRKRDGSRCVMCGSINRVGAHHWLYRRSHSMALAVDPANGISLCAFPCHLGRVHHDGDGDFILQLAAKMEQIVGIAKIIEMREKAKHPEPMGLEWWREAEQTLKEILGNRA